MGYMEFPKGRYIEGSDNLFSMMKGMKYRRMVSLVSEPLYLAYYMAMFSILYFVSFIRRRRLIDALISMAVILPFRGLSFSENC